MRKAELIIYALIKFFGEDDGCKAMEIQGGWPSRTLTRHGMSHLWQFHGWAAANSPWHVHRSQQNRRVPVT